MSFDRVTVDIEWIIVFHVLKIKQTSKISPILYIVSPNDFLVCLQVCGTGEFSYVAHTHTFCQRRKGDITCYAFVPIHNKDFR